MVGRIPAGLGRPDHRNGEPMTPRSGARGGADLHLHTLYSDGTARLADLLAWIERRTDPDLVAITDHDRIDGAARAAELHAAGDFHFELVVGEEVTTRSGHVVGLFLRADPGLPLGGRDRGAHPRPGRSGGGRPSARRLPVAGHRQPSSAPGRSAPERHLDAVELINPASAGASATGPSPS